MVYFVDTIPLVPVATFGPDDWDFTIEIDGRLCLVKAIEGQLQIERWVQ